MLRSLVLTAALLAPAGLHAQWIPVADDDASIPAWGTVRLGISARITTFDERFSRVGDGTREPLGADFSGDSVSIERLPPSLIAPGGIRALAAMPELPLSLGRMDVRLDSRIERLPISLEMGVLPRFAISATLPFVRTWTNVAVGPGLGEGATVGINPAFFHSGAFAQNTALVDAFASANAQLRSRLNACAGSNAPECAPVNQDRARAEAFANSAESFASNLAAVYLGSAAVPVAMTPAEQAIAERIAAMRGEFASYGVNGFAGAPASPVPATPLSHEDLQLLVTHPEFGVNADPLVRTERIGMGDLEFGARLLLINAMGRAGAEDRTPAAGLRFAVGGLVRFPTGATASPHNLLDIGTGEGHRALEGQALLDFFLARRLGVSVVSRFMRQLEQQRDLRIPEFAGEPFTLANRLRRVDRDPGDIFRLDIRPRLAFGEFFAVGGYYALIRKSADRHSNPEIVLDAELQDEQPLLDPSVLDIGTAFREQRAGVTISFSSVAAHARRRARFPFELSYTHLRSTSGRQGMLPIAREDRVQVRLYGRVWGRR